MTWKERLATPAGQLIQAVLLVGLAGALLALFFRGADLAAIGESLSQAHPGLIVSSLLFMLFTYAIRALRWQVLLHPLGRAGYVNCFATTTIGFMVNVLVPGGRVGEFARPYLLARREGFSASSAFATIFVERILDLVTVVALIAFWLTFGSVGAPGAEEALSGLKAGGLFGFAAAAAALGVMYGMARYPDLSRRWLRRLAVVFPARIAESLVAFVERFTVGFGVLTDRVQFLKASLLSLLLWLDISMAFWLGAKALQVEFPFGGTFLVIGFLTVGVAVPTPGGIGSYHVMCALALTMLFQTDASTAKAVALVSHAISYLPVTLIGILFLAKSGLSVRRLKTITTSS